VRVMNKLAQRMIGLLSKQEMTPRQLIDTLADGGATKPVRDTMWTLINSGKLELFRGRVRIKRD